jgi:hypothetical protein
VLVDFVSKSCNPMQLNLGAVSGNGKNFPNLSTASPADSFSGSSAERKRGKRLDL